MVGLFEIIIIISNSMINREDYSDVVGALYMQSPMLQRPLVCYES